MHLLYSLNVAQSAVVCQVRNLSSLLPATLASFAHSPIVAKVQEFVKGFTKVFSLRSSCLSSTQRKALLVTLLKLDTLAGQTLPIASKALIIVLHYRKLYEVKKC